MRVMVINTYHFQVEENDIWNDLEGHELMKIFDLDNPVYLYTKKRTMETVGRYLESRTNSYGYIIRSLT